MPVLVDHSITDHWILIAVQSMHANIHVYNFRGEVQGACGGKAPQVGYVRMFSPS